MLITRLSPAKDFHNNGLVLPLLRGSAGVIGEKVVDVELTKILLKAKLCLWLSQMQYFRIFSFLRCGEGTWCEKRNARAVTKTNEFNKYIESASDNYLEINRKKCYN